MALDYKQRLKEAIYVGACVAIGFPLGDYIGNYVIKNYLSKIVKPKAEVNVVADSVRSMDSLLQK